MGQIEILAIKKALEKTSKALILNGCGSWTFGVHDETVACPHEVQIQQNKTNKKVFSFVLKTFF